MWLKVRKTYTYYCTDKKAKSESVTFDCTSVTISISLRVRIVSIAYKVDIVIKSIIFV